jgi:triacylglycerol esterase/lipase EstA (alpha/beta hydrolase family)
MSRAVAKQARWRELVALAKHVPLMSTVSTDVTHYGERGDSDTLTVFVHGYMATGGVLRPLGEFLGREGVAARQVHFTFAPTGSVAEHVRKLDSLVQRARQSADGPVHIVGHSLGGLVGRYYRQVLGRRVDRLVCIATPHGGVPRASPFKALPLVDELAPGSSTLALLEATHARLAQTEVTCIVPSHDTLVSPEHSARLRGAKHVEVHGVGHLGVLFEQETWDHVADALRVSRVPRHRVA